MKLRPFIPKDLKAITQLFYDTVHTINRADYTSEQCAAWATEAVLTDHASWLVSLSDNDAFVMEHEGVIVGFVDISSEGYLDRLFVHKSYQNQGIGTKLVRAVEVKARERGLSLMSTEASITAKPFFEHHGFTVLEDQVVYKNGVGLRNFKMIKSFL